MLEDEDDICHCCDVLAHLRKGFLNTACARSGNQPLNGIQMDFSEWRIEARRLIEEHDKRHLTLNPST